MLRVTMTARIFLMLACSVLLSMLVVTGMYTVRHRVGAALDQKTQVAAPSTAAVPAHHRGARIAGTQTLRWQRLRVLPVKIWWGVLLLSVLFLSLGMLLAGLSWFLQPLAWRLAGRAGGNRGDLAHRVAGLIDDTLALRAISINQRAANLRPDRDALPQSHQVLKPQSQEHTATLSDTTAQLQRSRAEVRALVTRLLSLQEEERKHIAREMHDELGQVLTVLLLELARAGQFQEQAACQEQLDLMTGLVNRALDTLGNMITTLRPRVLDDLGLRAAVEWQVQEFQNRTAIACLLTIEPESLSLDADRATTVFRIVQEALTNVARHADATTVRITLRLTAQAIYLTVQDNGHGVSVEALDNPAAFGILGMRERALAYGGDCTIFCPQDGGTMVNIVLPLEDVPRAE